MATELKTFRFNKVVLQRFRDICRRYGDLSYHVNEALREYIDKVDKYAEGVAAVNPVAVVDKAIDYSMFGVSDDVILEINRIKKKNSKTASQAKMTQRIANTLAKEFKKSYLAGFTLDQILNEWETRGWQSFKADWLKGGCNEKAGIRSRENIDFNSDFIDEETANEVQRRLDERNS